MDNQYELNQEQNYSNINNDINNNNNNNNKSEITEVIPELTEQSNIFLPLQGENYLNVN